MKDMKKGDIVVRKSHNKDILFCIERIIKLTNGEKVAILKGLTIRIEADSYIQDLELAESEKIKNELERHDRYFLKIIENYNKFDNSKISEENTNIDQNDYYINKRYREIIRTGKILHLDGDKRYAEKSLRAYRRMGLNAIVKNISEYRQPKEVYGLLQIYKPDILVITGHDAMIKKKIGYDDLFNYRNSKYFIETVKEARRYDVEKNKNLVIFAGACQSYYEALILAGANFASSPARILIDFMDPLIVARNVAITDKIKYITINDFSEELRDGTKGINGIGANGKKSTLII